MIDLNRHTECTGCGACVNICPKDAITLAPDESGFLHPCIDEAKCVDCNLCNGVCQMDLCSEKAEGPGTFYALVNNNSQHLKVSSSGGAFLAVAEYVFSLGGLVAGCAFDENLKATHILTDNLAECIQKLCGSKYVQSETGQTFREVKSQLAAGKTVLYVGTPCQIEGLLLFLKGRPEKLITMDLICHGVSSPLLWKRHKEYLEHQAKGKLKDYQFRSKKKADAPPYYYHYTYGEKNRTKQGISLLDRYYTDFLKGLNHRESCYRCRYANQNRVGDLTIGDAWGSKTFAPELKARQGISLIAVNTALGEEVLKQISKNVTLQPVLAQAAAQYNHNLLAPSPRPAVRDQYYVNCFTDFEGWEKAYVSTGAWKLAKLKSLIPAPIKRLLGR